MGTTNNLVEVTLSNQAAQQVEQVNLGFEDIDRGVRGEAVVALSGSGSTTLGAAVSQNSFLKFTGALSGTKTVIVPEILGVSQPFDVWNATSGGHDILLGRSGGAAVTVPAGGAARVRLDVNGDMVIIGGSEVSGFSDYAAITPPARPATDHVRLYAKASGTSPHRELDFVVKLPDGEEAIIASYIS